MNNEGTCICDVVFGTHDDGFYDITWYDDSVIC